MSPPKISPDEILFDGMYMDRLPTFYQEFVIRFRACFWHCLFFHISHTSIDRVWSHSLTICLPPSFIQLPTVGSLGYQSTLGTCRSDTTFSPFVEKACWYWEVIFSSFQKLGRLQKLGNAQVDVDYKSGGTCTIKLFTYLIKFNWIAFSLSQL